jgi:drug/metabolite transporter superfamily protein YnfA
MVGRGFQHRYIDISHSHPSLHRRFCISFCGIDQNHDTLVSRRSVPITVAGRHSYRNRSEAVNLIKTPETSLSAGRVTAIHALHDKVSLWWRNLPTILKLEPESLTAVPGAALPLLLLTNLVYHQTLCVLHASIVPLFCWTAGDDAWSLTRQSSAQVAYEHACAVSALIRAALASTAKISAMPTFIAYAAYGGCAILMPFMWCSNLALRHQAQANVRTNIRMIHGMAEYWKFAALLVNALLL